MQDWEIRLFVDSKEYIYIPYDQLSDYRPKRELLSIKSWPICKISVSQFTALLLKFGWLFLLELIFEMLIRLAIL